MQARHIIVSAYDTPCFYCTSSLVLPYIVYVLYKVRDVQCKRGCTVQARHIIMGAYDTPCLYCTSSLVLPYIVCFIQDEGCAVQARMHSASEAYHHGCL